MSLTRSVIKRFVAAMEAECERSVANLRVPGYPRPYYISYLLRDVHTTHIWGRLGNINQSSDLDARNVYCDCRVGSYRFDQVAEGGLDDNDSDCESYDLMEMPIGNDPDALRYHLWKLTDARYREGVRRYLKRKSDRITYVDPNGDLPSFRRLPKVRDLRFRRVPPVDLDAWRRFVVRTSRVVKRHPEVKNSWVELRVRDVTRLFVSSEGSAVVDQARVCELSCDLWLLTPEGEGVSTRIQYTTPRLADLPDARAFAARIRRRVRLLCELARAPTLKAYAGPVLLMPGPAGILFHEVLGHRLEGSRLLSSREGHTFMRDLGKRTLPPAITVYDDPTLAEIGGVGVVGHYRYDDEGSPARRADLVRAGKLTGFLTGRAPVLRGRRVPPNGHARNEYHERPVSRMANLVVEIDGGVSEADLVARLLEEVARQGLPYGIIVDEAHGGETATDTYDFQAFKGEVALARRVYPDGRFEYVRNVDFVGTPLSALRSLLAAGDTPRTENAFCGAESGIVPVSTTCPAVLMGNLELQASDARKYTQYVLPMPHEVAAR